MEISHPSTTENENEQQKQQLYKVNTYENTKHIINESIKHFNEFTNSINEVSKHANLFASSLQSLEDVAMPEVIGSSMYLKVPKKKIFDSTEHLKETLDSLSKILTSYTEKIKNETIEEFDNFIMQVICPSHDELKGIYDHNNNIIEEYRNGFYSLMNHFYVLGAELLEKFLICGDCNTPIGFTHQPTCNAKYEKSFVWKKKKVDDKFITYNMNCSFDDLVIPGRRGKIIKMINKTLTEQCQVRSNDKPVLPITIKNSWPIRYSRSGGNFGGNGNKKARNKSNHHHHNRHTYPVQIVHPPIFNPTIWTPNGSEAVQLVQNYEVISFSYK